MPDLIKTDHDLLISLAARLEAHSTRESEVSRATLSEVSRLGAKLDAIGDTQKEQSRDLREIRSKQRDDDIRIATLESQVDSLKDDASAHRIAADAVREEARRRAREWGWIAIVTSPIVAIVVPVLFKALIALIAGTP